MIVQSDKNSLAHIRQESEKRLGPRAAPPPRQKLGMGDFLHLMISQLQYQDPLHPLNNTRFAAQLAQFSQLDQLTHLNRGVGTIAHDGADANKMMMVGFLGQEVTMKGNAFHLAPSGNVSLTFRQSGASASGHLRIFDGLNHLVRTIALKSMGAGSHKLDWDGVTDQGVRAPKGSYSFEIDAMDGRHRPVPATPVETGTVTGILFEKGQPVLEVDGKPVAFGDISHVGEPRTSVSSRAQDKGPNRKTAAEDSLPGGEGASRNAGPIRKLPSTVTRRI